MKHLQRMLALTLRSQFVVPRVVWLLGQLPNICNCVVARLDTEDDEARLRFSSWRWIGSVVQSATRCLQPVIV